MANSTELMALLNEYEVAKILNLKVPTLRRWRWAGSDLPFVKIGSAVRYRQADVAEFIEAGYRTSTSGPEVS